MDLHDDVDQGVAEGAGQRQFGAASTASTVPRTISDQAANERRGDSFSGSLSMHRLGRIAGPGVALQLLLAEPHQVVGPRRRQLDREHAAGGRRQRLASVGIGPADRGGAERPVACVLIDPGAQRAQLRASTAPRRSSASRRRGTAPRRWRRAAAAACAGCGTAPAASRPRWRWPRSAAARAGAPAAPPARARSSRSRRCAWTRPRPAGRRRRARIGQICAARSGGRRSGPTACPSRTSDTTSVAVTPMFFRYCRCSGDMLRR